jgi:hypothetical protein
MFELVTSLRMIPATCRVRLLDTVLGRSTAWRRSLKNGIQEPTRTSAPASLIGVAL